MKLWSGIQSASSMEVSKNFYEKKLITCLNFSGLYSKVFSINFFCEETKQDGFLVVAAFDRLFSELKIKAGDVEEMIIFSDGGNSEEKN